MASAELLKFANTVDNKVEGIANNVLVDDNWVAGRVAGVDEHERVAGVDDREPASTA
jgi:hypothetical protein